MLLNFNRVNFRLNFKLQCEIRRKLVNGNLLKITRYLDWDIYNLTQVRLDTYFINVLMLRLYH